MPFARRVIAILIGCATWCIASTTVGYASMLHDPVPAAPPVLTSAGSSGTPLWQLLALVALGVLLGVVLLGVATVSLGYSRSRSRRSERPQKSQQLLPHRPPPFPAGVRPSSGT